MLCWNLKQQRLQWRSGAEPSVAHQNVIKSALGCILSDLFKMQHMPFPYFPFTEPQEVLSHITWIRFPFAFENQVILHTWSSWWYQMRSKKFNNRSSFKVKCTCLHCSVSKCFIYAVFICKIVNYNICKSFFGFLSFFFLKKLLWMFFLLPVCI